MLGVRRRPAAPHGRRGLRRIPPAAVPSFFTLMNLLSGFLAVLQIHQGAYVGACWLIVLAGVFDLFDGMMARLTKSNSAFGVELDSLADVVSFGLAPSFRVYQVGLNAHGLLGLLVAALPVLCGAVRLARFNVTHDGEKKDTFTGLPIPMQAAAVVALVLNVERNAFVLYSPGGLTLLVPIVITLAGLMVSRVPFDAGPRPSAFYIRSHPRKALLYTIGLVLVIALQHRGLLLVLTVYLLAGMGTAAARLVRTVRAIPPRPDPA